MDSLLSGKEIKKMINDFNKVILDILLDSIPHAKDFNDLNGMAEVAFSIDKHEYLGLVIAKRADELGIEELSVGEYDHDRVLLKIKEVPEEDDYYGFGEVFIGDWVSSSY